MSILRQAKLVEDRKDGRWIYYKLAGKDAGIEIQQAIRWVKNCLMEDKHVQSDLQLLKKVRRINKEELCACYKAAKPKKTVESQP